MNRPRVTAPALGAALLFSLLLVLPAASLALPAGAPPLSPATRAALSAAAGNRAFLPWQRQVMRGLADPRTAPARSTGVATGDGAWSKLPAPTSEAAAVYDPVRHSMLYFGGRLENSNLYTNELWELSLATYIPTWSLVVTTGAAPSPRGAHVLLFDSTRERLLLFGGVDSMTHNDFWTLDLTTGAPYSWAQGAPTGTLPSRRAYCQAVYDATTDRVVLFGGADSVDQTGQGGPSSPRSDVWVLPFTGTFAWTELTPAGTPPSARAAGAVIYDPPRQRMVLFGGYDGSNILGDAFALSLGGSPAWSTLGATGTPPSARAIPGVAYIAAPAQMVIFAGIDGGMMGLNDLSSLDLVNDDWVPLSPVGSPPSPRQAPAVVWDVSNGRLISYGGGDSTGSVVDPLWEVRIGGPMMWTNLGGQLPPRRWNAAAAVDPTRRRMWVHGGDSWEGSGRTVRSDTWTLDLASRLGWGEEGTTGVPLGKRIGHSAIYDSQHDRLVFFGGTDTTSYFNDVWTLQFSSGMPDWSVLTTSGTPPAGRMYHSAVYDAVHDRMVVFGGMNGSGTRNDVWVLSFAGTPTWSQLTPSGTPPPTPWGQCADLDRDANRLIVFGGDAGGPSNQVYALTLNGSPAWTQLLPSGTAPPVRSQASMVSLGTRMLVFGGYSGGAGFNSLNDCWLLSLYPAPAWRQLDVGSVLPPARMGACAGFDQSGFQLAIFGGTSMNFSGGDTWFLQLDQAVPALASLVSANAGPDRVELEWELASSPATVTVYRSAGGGEWTAIGAVAPGGGGRVQYVDLAVVAGSRYGYRLGLPGAGSEVFVGEAWVNVPETARFALRGMTPNPGRAGAGLVAFSLPDGAPAQLEVMDVSGRRVFSREVGALGRGEHTVRVNGAAPLAPGLYLVRLTRGDGVLTAKAVTIP